MIVSNTYSKIKLFFQSFNKNLADIFFCYKSKVDFLNVLCDSFKHVRISLFVLIKALKHVNRQVVV